MQLLSYQAPLSALLLVGFVPIFDNYKEILSYKMTLAAGSAIAASALCAFLVNISTFMIIGKMSAITYNVAGHAKLCFVLAAGYILFDNRFNWLNMVGVSIAITGVVAYSIIRMMPNKPVIQPETLKQAPTEHVSILLKPISGENAEEDSEIEDKENDASFRRSLLIVNNEPVVISGGNKVAPLLPSQKQQAQISEANESFENDRVTLIK